PQVITLQDEKTLAGQVYVDGVRPLASIELEFEPIAMPAALSDLSAAVHKILDTALVQHGLHFTATNTEGEFSLRGLPRDSSGSLRWPEPFVVEESPGLV